MLAGAPAAARVVLNGPNGTPFAIEDTGGGELSGPAAFDGWPRLCVRVCAACDDPCAAGDIYAASGAASAGELNNRQRALAAQNMAGLSVQRRVYVPNAGQANADGFVRYLDTLTNNSGAAITVAVRVGSVGLGGGHLRDNAATIWRTHSDDAQLEARDRWLLTDDGDPTGQAAALGILIFGAGGLTPSTTSFAYADPNRASALAWQYTGVRIGAGQSASFLTAVTHETNRADALTEVEHLLEAQAVDLLFGLTEAQRRSIVNFDVDPQNAAPLADAGGPYSAPEASQVGLSAAGSYDAEGAVLDYAWDLDDDGEFDDAVGSNTFVTFNDDGTYPVHVRVTDPAGKFDIATAQVSVTNVDPRIDSVNAPGPIVEGSRQDVVVRVTDPGADELFIDFDWDGDGTYDDVAGRDLQVSHLYPSDGVFQAQVRVRDDDGGQAVRSFEVVVLNGAPQVPQLFAPPGVAEGSQFQVNTLASDPGNDPLTYCYDLDDDGEYEQCGLNLTEVTARFDDDGFYTLRVRVEDDAGARTTRSTQVSVTNVRPTIVSVTNTGPVNEGSPVRVDIAATDPGADTLDYSFDWNGINGYADDIRNQAASFAEHTFFLQGEHRVGVRVRDDDGGFIEGATTVVVNNVPPVGSIEAPQFVVEGSAFDIVVRATDAGMDPLTYSWDFDGDGDFELPDSGLAQVRHTFNEQGDFTIRCVVSDGDGGSLELTAPIRVRNELPQLQIELQSPQGEGAEVAIRAVANDAGNDELMYSFDVDDDGIFEFDPQADPVVRWRFPDEGFYTIRVLVDDGSDVVDATREIEIINVAPTVRVTSNSPVNEGEEMVFTAEVDDPGSNDVITLRWTVQGQEYVVEVAGEDDLELRVPAADDGIFNATVVASDDDGGESEQRATQMVVANLPPELSEIAFVRPATEGQRYDLVVPATDPGPADRADLRFGLIDPPVGASIQAETGLILWIPTFDQAFASPITLTVTVSDGDGGTDQGDIVVDVFYLDEDADGLPDTYERNICDGDGNCLDPTNPDDAQEDPDMDGRSNLQEWMDDTDPFAYEGATTPRLISPDDGERVDTLTPTFDVSAVQSNDPDDELFIIYEIYGDAELQDVLFTSQPQRQAENSELNRFVLEGGIVFEDADYWWRASALAGQAQSPWSAARRFRTNATNEPPTTPMLMAPANMAIVDTDAPQLQALPATDPDGDAIVYKFRIYTRTGDPLVNGVGDAGDGFFFYETAAAGLAENGTYQWDVVAEDEAGALSAPSERWTFTINTENEAPSVPNIVYPDGSDDFVESAQPECAANGSRDDDDAQVGYVFRVRLLDGPEFLEESLPVIPAAGEDALWTPTTTLAEDTDHTLEVYAIDDDGAVSGTASVDFFVSAVEDPPTLPVHRTPADGGKVRFEDACATWTESTDPERGAVEYRVRFCDANDACGVSTNLRRTGFCFANQVTPGKTYSWQVESLDSAGQTSGLTEPWFFDVENPSRGGGSEGCRAAPAMPSDAPWGLLALGLLAICRRRR